MLLRSLPQLASASAAFRQWWDSKWGQENCIVLGRSRRADFGPCAHTLSIRAVWGGTQFCQVGARSIGVDEDSFLILNHGRVYSTSIRASSPVESLSICFRPELAAGMPEFMENLQPHDDLVSPVLRRIRAQLLLGVDDDTWYEQQLRLLLNGMRAHRIRSLQKADRLQLQQRARGRDLLRRIGEATDFLHTNYSRVLELDELAAVACLSKYHFLRLFTHLHGITPTVFLQRKRTAVAVRLLQTTRLTVNEVAAAVGFPERTTLLRQVRRWTGLSPLQIREQNFQGKLSDIAADAP